MNYRFLRRSVAEINAADASGLSDLAASSVIAGVTLGAVRTVEDILSLPKDATGCIVLTPDQQSAITKEAETLRAEILVATMMMAVKQ